MNVWVNLSCLLLHLLTVCLANSEKRKSIVACSAWGLTCDGELKRRSPVSGTEASKAQKGDFHGTNRFGNRLYGLREVSHRPVNDVSQ